MPNQEHVIARILAGRCPNPDPEIPNLSDGDKWPVRNGETHRTSHSDIDAQLAVRRTINESESAAILNEL
jgi:hypothetical protein